MYEVDYSSKMKNLKSLSFLVGKGICDANCNHCGGKIHRKNAPKKDGIILEETIYEILRDGYYHGARSVSISGSGEPTLSPLAVTKTLDIISCLKKENIFYSKVNLYSNGIRIGYDKKFCDEYLPKWQNLGLKKIYLTVHSFEKEKNAKIYGVSNYPSLEKIVGRIHENSLLVRANIVLTKENISNIDSFKNLVFNLQKIGFDSISSWPIRTEEDKIDYILSPSNEDLDKIEKWISEQDTSYPLVILREKDNLVYSEGQKLTLFPDGRFDSSWC